MRKFIVAGIQLVIVATLKGSLALAQPSESATLRPPHDELQPSFWELHRWQVAGAAAGVLILGALIFILSRRPKTVVVEPASIVARRALEKLRGRSEDGVLIMEVSRIFRRYVMAALKLPVGELTTTELRGALQSQQQMPPDLAGRAGDFLRRCDEWKFAPAPPAPQPGVVSSALELVGEVEVNTKSSVNEEVAA